jgi:hypothetical protein
LLAYVLIQKHLLDLLKTYKLIVFNLLTAQLGFEINILMVYQFLIRLTNQFLTFKSNFEHENAPTNNLLAQTRFEKNFHQKNWSQISQNEQTISPSSKCQN